MSRPCGELLYPEIGECIDILIRDRMWSYGDDTTAKLRAMKEHTVKRRVGAFRKKEEGGKGRSTTRPSSIKGSVPVFKGPWGDLPVGTGQIDTVAHCGDSVVGDFVYTLTYIDTATYWSIVRAQWNKGAEATKESMVYVKETLLVPLLHIHPDSGTEFLNGILLGWCREHDVIMTRSEPYKKNDNQFVEERNNHVVRKYVGYDRLDCRDGVSLLNAYYEVLGCISITSLPTNVWLRRLVSAHRL
jgi:hypothetical protein